MKFFFLEVLMLPFSNGRAQNLYLSKETTTLFYFYFFLPSKALQNLQNTVKYKSKMTH